jgi:hypothetical protein
MRLGKRAFLLLPVAVLALVIAALPTVVLGKNAAGTTSRLCGKS